MSAQNFDIPPELLAEIQNLAAHLNMTPQDVIADAISGYAALNTMQAKVIEQRLNDQDQDRFASPEDVAAVFGKYRDAH